MFFKSIDKESSYPSAVGWCRTSELQLRDTAAHLLSGVKSLEQETYVDIGPIIDPAGDRVLTIQANLSSRRVPLLLVHGFGCGSGLWCNNIDALATDRPVYAIDLVGFGRSSRPNFSTDPFEAEAQFVRTIEAWREVMGLQKFYLCGHSFGGYLCTLYSMQHPTRVEHLILVDPWGFPSRPPDYKLPMWMLPIEVGAGIVLPLFALRAAGPLGYLYLRLVPPFDTSNFSNVSNPRQATIDYFYHVNVKKPSGEKAFHSLMSGIAWAKHPIIPRLGGLKKEVPITFLYGEKTWVWKRTGFEIQKLRSDSYVDVQIVAAAGHAVGSDQPAVFNAIVKRVLNSVDSGQTPRNLLTDSSLVTSDMPSSSRIPCGQSSSAPNISVSCNDLMDNGSGHDSHNAVCDHLPSVRSDSCCTSDGGCDTSDDSFINCNNTSSQDHLHQLNEEPSCSSPCDSGHGTFTESPRVQFDLGDDDQFYDTTEDTDQLADECEDISFLSADENDEFRSLPIENASLPATPRSFLTQIAELISPNSLDLSSIQSGNSRSYPNLVLPTKLSGLYIDPKEAMARLQRYMEDFIRRR